MAFAFQTYDPETFERQAAAAAARGDADDDDFFDFASLGISNEPGPYDNYDLAGGEIPYYASTHKTNVNYYLHETIKEYREIREKWYYAIEESPRGNLDSEAYHQVVLEKYMSIMKIHAEKGNKPEWKAAWRDNPKNGPDILQARPNAQIFCTIKNIDKVPKQENGEPKERNECAVCAEAWDELCEPYLEAINCGHSLHIGCFATLRKYAFETGIGHNVERDSIKCPTCRGPVKINGGVIMW